jgi:hypothetical protein
MVSAITAYRGPDFLAGNPGEIHLRVYAEERRVYPIDVNYCEQLNQLPAAFGLPISAETLLKAFATRD